NALKTLADLAAKARDEAQAAADAATAALAEQQSKNATLQAQLATLQTDQVHTEAEYTEGIRATFGASGDTIVSSSGWALPAFGPITSGFGARVSPCSGCSSNHMGTDIGASCNNSIFAGSSGTVVFAGYNGGYGNFVLIDHGDGVQTGYGHIVNGGTLVHVGEQVGVGQNIAKVGRTGAATGCHLHYELRINGHAQNAVPFMAARGITLGTRG
ncbi:MAG: peptidoglycan DD-metalloendopeptidase family protein, partial [Microbacteriaceae bacterium]|nr:peptidoglycan DD-metalloendopeptidase family protein [Microbacteriaceae bacterium]